MTTGANRDGFHWRNVSMARDIAVKHWADLRVVNAGEKCPKCDQPLKVQRR
jgi:prolyl-tRNA synthetase